MSILNVVAVFILNAQTPTGEASPAPVPLPDPSPYGRVYEPPAPAAAEEEAAAEEASEFPNISFSGNVRSVLGVMYRPSALPRDVWTGGVQATNSAFQVAGQFSEKVGYKARLELSVNTSSDGTVGSILEEASTYYEPTPGLKLSFGHIRVPFSLPDANPNAQQMFPDRPGPTALLSFGIDLGGLASYALPQDRAKISVGVWHGNDVASGGTNERGALYTARVDFTPLGALPGDQDFDRGGFRFEIGGGVGYRPSRVYDSSNFLSTRRTDTRVTASAKIAVRGFTTQFEWLRRDATDNVSQVLQTDTGMYVQAAYYFQPSSKVGVGPIFRFGDATEDVLFFPRRTQWIEAGWGIYFASKGSPDRARILVNYISENRITEGDRAQGAQLQYRVLF